MHGLPRYAQWPVLDPMETREVGIDRNELISRDCRLTMKSNVKNDVRGWPSYPRPTYYVKKRFTLDRKENDGLLTYQFIASRKPLVQDFDDDYTETLDPGPEEREPSTKNNRNRFRTDIGMLYCERSTMKKLTMTRTPNQIQNHRKNHGCGIEETLVTLCLRDTDDIIHHNPFNGINTLNLDNEFDEHFDANGNVQNDAMRDSARHIKDMIRGKCIYLVKIDMTNDKGKIEKTKEKAKHFLRGAQIANFEDVFVRQYVCPGLIDWLVYQTNWLLADNDAFDEVFDNTGDIWYLCSTI